MDLTDFAALEDLTLDVVNPNTKLPLKDDAGKPVQIIFHNIDTQPYIRARNQYINATRALSHRGNVVTVEQDLEIGITFLAAITKGWSSMPAFKQKLEFNEKNCKRVYSGVHWLRQQVDDFVQKAGLRVKVPTEGSPEP